MLILILRWTCIFGMGKFAMPILPTKPIYTEEYVDALVAACQDGSWAAYIEGTGDVE